MARRHVALAAFAAAALAVSACGGGDAKEDEKPAPGQTQLTVYSSLPLQGPSRPESESLVNAEKLALSQSGGRVGPFTVKYVSMDDSRAEKGRWDPAQVIANTRKALKDRTAIAYLGEGDSGASAIAIPVLNEAGVLTVSPTSTYAGLTRRQDADKGEPEKYYPSGQRTFARVVPADHHQAAAQVALQEKAGCRRLFVVGDRDVYGRGIATAVARQVTAGGQKLAGEASLPPGQDDFSGLSDEIAKARPDCVFTGLTLADDAAAVYAAIGRAAPRAELFGPDALADARFAAALPESIAERTQLTTLRPSGGGARARRFAAAYAERYGQAPEPMAVYGYEAMKAVLASIAAAGNQGNDRAEVVKRFLAIRDRPSVLGTYSIGRDGDTTLSAYTLGRVEAGKLRFGARLDAGT